MDNDRVGVIRIKYGGREGSVMHQHAGVGIFLSDAKFKFSYPDGKTEVRGVEP